MAGVIVEPSLADVERLISEVEEHLRVAARELEKPPIVRRPPVRLPGFWQSFEAAGTMLTIAHDIGYGSGAVERGEQVLAAMRRQAIATGEIDWIVTGRGHRVGYVTMLQTYLAIGRELAQRLARIASHSRSGEDPPTSIVTQTGEQLARTTARLASWRIGHHRFVHAPDAIAAGRTAGAEDAAGAAIDAALRAAATHLRYLSQVRIPDLRARLDARLHELRADMAAGDVRLEQAIDVVERTLTRELRELRTEIATEIVPAVEELIAVEEAQRRQADRLIRGMVSTEADARAGTDAEIMAAVAPLAAWAQSFGVHTTTKVKRLEPSFDEMLGPRFDWWSMLLIPGAFAALVTKMIVDVAGALPEVLSGLEDAAGKVLAIEYGR